MRARKVGRRVENPRVRMTYITNTTYSLISIATHVEVGRAEKTPTGFRARVGERKSTFGTMADVKVWASNLIYDDPTLEELPEDNENWH